MEIIDFVNQSTQYQILEREANQFSREEYEGHLKNVCSLSNQDKKPYLRMLKASFCVNLWCSDVSESFSSTSLSQTNQNTAVFYKCNVNTFASAKTTAPHQHDYYEFVYIYRGHYYHRLNGETYHYKENQFLMLEPGVYHQDSLEEGSIIFFFCASKEFFGNLVKNPLFQSGLSCTPAKEGSHVQFSVYAPNSRESAQTARLLIEQLVREIAQSQLGSVLIAEGLFHRLIGILFDTELYTCEKQIIATKAQERFNTSEELQAYLWSRNGKATRNEITERFHYCSDYLNRLLKCQTGWTISKYNQYITMEKAAQMLRETDKSIADIIGEAGFENHSFFYRLFEKKYGNTPNVYRQQEKTNANNITIK